MRRRCCLLRMIMRLFLTGDKSETTVMEERTCTMENVTFLRRIRGIRISVYFALRYRKHPCSFSSFPFHVQKFDHPTSFYSSTPLNPPHLFHNSPVKNCALPIPKLQSSFSLLETLITKSVFGTSHCSSNLSAKAL